MSIEKHGLSIGIERVKQRFYLTLRAIGKLTHEDYQIVTPLIDSALSKVDQPKVDALVDITQLQGWELEAAWDDFKFGLKHGREFEKIAIIGNKPWQEWATKVAGWFISGETNYFENKDEAIIWLHEHNKAEVQ